MKKSILAILICCAISRLSLAQPNFGLTAQYHFESEETGYLDPPDRYSDLGPSIALRFDLIFEIGDVFEMGTYTLLSPSTEIYRLDATFFMGEIGFLIGPRFDVGSNHELRAYAQLGVKGLFSSEFDPMGAFGTNLNANFVFNKDNKISPKVDIGFIAQPAGGNDDIFFSHSPYWYIGGGIIIH